MSTVQDFEISHKEACLALGLKTDALTGVPLGYKMLGDGSRVSWAVDIAKALRLKRPHLALAKMKLQSLAQ